MLLSLALLVAAADPPAQPTPNFYERVERRILSDPAAIAAVGHPAPQMHEVAWLVGTWDVAAMMENRGGSPETGTSVIAPAMGGAWLEVRNSYAHGAQASGYLGYSIIESRWTYVAIDNLMSVNRSSAAAWAGNRIVFEGDFTFLGESAHVRHTLTRQDPDSFSIVDEERVEGGGWRRLEVFYYHRRPAVS